MKIWIKTDMKNIKDKLKFLSYSLFKINFPNEVLLRISGTKKQINTFLLYKITDEKAKAIIQLKNPNNNLENIDVPDIEIDEIAKIYGLNPNIRKDIQIPTYGKQILQNQINYLLKHISIKQNKSKEFWDIKAKETNKWKKGIDIEIDILNGNGEAQEFILSNLRIIKEI